MTAIIVTALVLNMAGALLGKYLGMFTSQYIVFGLLFMLLLAVYAFRVVFWLMVGKRWQISFIYPVLSLNYIFSFLLGLALFREAFEFQRLAASFVIIVGVILVSRSPHRRERTRQ
ncbi:MAG TPA: hypothetical protein PLO37_22480 [Candidatus Hydrogenedentes bacterium]|nr:hypothetical protein [Candidatus Hydrogenedentota bacterium]HPG69623.1 hypothetical protein [Candidatus Hydrogenedentota bacterium]